MTAGARRAPTRTSIVAGEVIDAPTGVIEELAARRAALMKIAGVVQVTMAAPMQVEVTATPEDDSPVVEVPRTAEARSVHRLPVVGLTPTRPTTSRSGPWTTRVRWSAGAPSAHDRPAPGWMPDFRVDVSDPARMAPGYTLFDVQRWGVDTPPGRRPPGALVIVDPPGRSCGTTRTTSGPATPA